MIASKARSAIQSYKFEDYKFGNFTYLEACLNNTNQIAEDIKKHITIFKLVFSFAVIVLIF